MIRFILCRKTYTAANEDRQEAVETLDCDVPLLEQALKRGGVGGGCNDDDYDHTTVVGTLVIRD